MNTPDRKALSFISLILSIHLLVFVETATPLENIDPQVTATQELTLRFRFYNLKPFVLFLQSELLLRRLSVCRRSSSRKGKSVKKYKTDNKEKMSEKKGRKEEVVTREYTINLHRRLHSCTFKKKAPKAIKEIRKFAEKAMGTKDVRVDVKLNKQIWSKGIRGPPRRIRVRVARKRNDDEDAKEEFFSLVTVAEIPAEGLSGLGTKVIDEED
ncbi:Ribosomal protein L31e protein [Raphanus sativus]|nr:Ribosomal protein L31e protein [Raphanus sativus]